jgi:hypothetical protein
VGVVDKEGRGRIMNRRKENKRHATLCDEYSQLKYGLNPVFLDGRRGVTVSTCCIKLWPWDREDGFGGWVNQTNKGLD